MTLYDKEIESIDSNCLAPCKQKERDTKLFSFFIRPYAVYSATSTHQTISNHTYCSGQAVKKQTDKIVYRKGRDHIKTHISNQ